MFLTEQALLRDAEERQWELKYMQGAQYLATFDRLGAQDLDEWNEQWVIDSVSKIMDVMSELRRKQKAMFEDWANKWGPPTRKEMEKWQAWTSEAGAAAVITLSRQT